MDAVFASRSRVYREFPRLVEQFGCSFAEYPVSADFPEDEWSHILKYLRGEAQIKSYYDFIATRPDSLCPEDGTPLVFGGGVSFNCHYGHVVRCRCLSCGD